MLAERLTTQLLSSHKASTPSEVVERLLAVQAQDFRGMHLAIRARTTGLVASDLDRALGERELVVTWANRGTLHLVRAEDYPWLHALTTPQLATGNASRLAQEGVSPEQADRGVVVLEKALEDGPRTRAQLKVLLQEAGVPVAGQALVHLLLRATLRGICVRGPVVGREQAFVLVHDWLPKAKQVDRDAALGELGRRYLAGHAPATHRDLARWAGITLGDARRALDGLTPPAVAEVALPPPTLLGAFDEVLMGWESRDLVLAGHHEVVTMNGIFKPIALVRGKAVATWALPRGHVAIEAFDALAATVERALEREAADVERFLAG
ncbi:MAG TPA: winged helix DNA-binding domain-containing protein [Mycobacteriales bacterium]|nr:winged helix DNA-binding domain-containing protein [Mycobacteriales bacterium]